MKKIIITTHGLGNKPPGSLLRNWWLKAVHEGLNRIGKDENHIPFEMVYWADVFYPKPLDPEVQDEKASLYLHEPYTEGASIVEEREPTLKVKLLKYLEDQLDKVFLNDDLSLNFSRVTEKVLHYFFTELETYFAKDCMALNSPECFARDELRNRLYNILKKYSGYKILLISHSMGSIVAFDVLSNCKDELNIHTFVTIGSPLGLPVVVEWIFHEQQIRNQQTANVHAPDCIQAFWFNLSDPEDMVALDHTLADDFSENRHGIRAVDMLVNNDYQWQGEKNPHKSYGYLRTKEMATIIDQFLNEA